METRLPRRLRTKSTPEPTNPGDFDTSLKWVTADAYKLDRPLGETRQQVAMVELRRLFGWHRSASFSRLRTRSDSVDNLVCPSEDGCRDRDSQGLGCLQIDNEAEPVYLLDR
jgi:hypothetical protein